MQALPGRPTRMWTYGGTFPGPTIRRPAGQRTEVTFHHELPPSVGELTVHLHGGHNRTQFDGQPGGLTASHATSFYCDIPRGLSPRQSGNDVLIEPGGRRTYVYDLIEDGRPERAAFQWYHDHRLDHTARNVWHGLAGMWIVDDEFEAGLPLPSGERDLPLMLVDRSFDRPQPARRPVHQPAPACRRDQRPHDPGQRRPPALPPGQRPALPPAHPQRLAVSLLQPLPLQRRADGSDRHRQRLDAAAGAARGDPDRAGRAGRADRRLQRGSGRVG